MYKTSRLWITGLLLIALILSGSISARSTTHRSSQTDATQPPCSDCHVCSSPTEAEPCLEMCLWTHTQSAPAHSASEGPTMTVLDKLAEFYGPVRFNHRLHAEMVGMGEGCGICHHFSPAGKFPPCAECHGDRPSNPQNLRRPSLKGAYHRQCMGCHREWSHDTKCVVCHLPAETASMANAPIDTTDILGISHPRITIPDKKVWTTPYEKGPTVTLHHQEHIDLFGLRCVDCHRGENCSYCHDYRRENHVSKTDQEIHAICNDCHENDACSKCHNHKEKPAFSHAVDANWPLNVYHQGLDCRGCHPTGRRISKLNSDCVSCHGGWNQGNFRHALTGLQLDDIHSEVDCADCHANQAYSRIPKCGDCHDDCRNHEDAPPGVYIGSLSGQ